MWRMYVESVLGQQQEIAGCAYQDCAATRCENVTLINAPIHWFVATNFIEKHQH